MSGGRTTWWPCDAAEHDRELNVELGEEFGPGGPLVMRVLKDLAQQQRAVDGTVRSGFRVLRQKCFLKDTDEGRLIVEHAAAIGALDGLEIDEDGRRFGCRVSGWAADRERGRAAWRKAEQRQRDSDADPHFKRDPGDVVTPERDKTPEVTESHTSHTKYPTVNNRTLEEQGTTTTVDFPAWLEHHASVTGQHQPKAGTKALEKVAGMYRARRAEGYSADDLCLATVGAFNDPYRREHGHYGCESVLRPEKVHDLIEKGRRPVQVVREHPASVRIREIDQLRAMLPADEEVA